jgi:hypothetical protein
MSEAALIKRDDSKLAIAFTDEAHNMLAEAIGLAAMVAKVDSKGSQDIAVDAQKACRRVIKLVEDARKEVKAPILDFGRAIDDAAAKFVELAKKEEMRIAKLAGDYQQHLLAKARSEESAKRKELEAIERAREEQLAAAKSLQERERIHEEHSQLQQALTPPPAPPKAEGQSVEEVWCFEVENPHLLANAHPQFVTIEPKRREITEALKGGFSVKGVKAWKEVRSRVRLGREPKAIELATA